MHTEINCIAKMLQEEESLTRSETAGRLWQNFPWQLLGICAIIYGTGCSGRRLAEHAADGNLGGGGGIPRSPAGGDHRPGLGARRLVRKTPSSESCRQWRPWGPSPSSAPIKRDAHPKPDDGCGNLDSPAPPVRAGDPTRTVLLLGMALNHDVKRTTMANLPANRQK